MAAILLGSRSGGARGDGSAGDDGSAGGELFQYLALASVQIVQPLGNSGERGEDKGTVHLIHIEDRGTVHLIHIREMSNWPSAELSVLSP